MLREPPMAEGYDFEAEKHGREFLYRIIERGNRPFDKDPLAKDIVSQLRNDVVYAWDIIDSLKKEAASNGLIIGENIPVLNVHIPLIYRAANRLYRWTQHGIGRVIKNIIKAPLKLFRRKPA